MRYVRNVDTRRVHNADCFYANGRLLPWPRWSFGVSIACGLCLPGGLPPADQVRLVSVYFGRELR